MGKCKTKTFTVERRMYTQQWMENTIDTHLDVVNRTYDNAVRHYKPIVEELRKDIWYQYCQEQYAATPEEDEETRKLWSDEVYMCMAAYGITEYGIHGYLGKGKKYGSCHVLNADIVQKTGSFFYQSAKKAALAGAQIHYRKYGQTDTLECKKANTGIIYDQVNDIVKYAGMKIPLKKVRKKDFWMKEALTHKVKYCRIVRRAYGSVYHYFLQIVMEGDAPEKISKGTGRTAEDPGVSTMSFYGDNICQFALLAPDTAKYEKNIRKCAQEYERRRRMANPQNYNADGTIRKDTKNFKKYWKHTKGEKEALMRLKSAYRLMAAYVKQSGDFLANRVVESCSELIKEPMNYRALAKRAKETSRRDKEEAVKKKDGSVKMVKKCKRKKRFGHSLLCHAPGQYNQRLEAKCGKYGVKVINVDVKACKASQYDHTTDDCRKPLLSERIKKIDGFIVQRDLYSAFLLYCSPDGSGISRELCIKNFLEFIKKHSEAVLDFILDGQESRNFGMTIADLPAC